MDKCAHCQSELGNSRRWYDGKWYHPTCSPLTNAAASQARISALEAQLAERVKAAYLKGRSEWAPARVLSDNERTERDWQSALSALEATPPAPKVTEADDERLLAKALVLITDYGHSDAKLAAAIAQFIHRETHAALTAAQDKED